MFVGTVLHVLSLTVFKDLVERAYQNNKSGNIQKWKDDCVLTVSLEIYAPDRKCLSTWILMTDVIGAISRAFFEKLQD